jgi:hypothetical protein
MAGPIGWQASRRVATNTATRAMANTTPTIDGSEYQRLT